MPWQRVEVDRELAPGEKCAVKVGDREILICRIADNYYALSNRCTHSAWPLSGEPVEGFEILCTLHGARFDLRDGCPTAGPARKPLATYPIEFREGELYVSI